MDWPATEDLVWSHPYMASPKTTRRSPRSLCSKSPTTLRRLRLAMSVWAGASVRPGQHLLRRHGGVNAHLHQLAERVLKEAGGGVQRRIEPIIGRHRLPGREVDRIDADDSGITGRTVDRVRVRALTDRKSTRL